MSGVLGGGELKWNQGFQEACQGRAGDGISGNGISDILHPHSPLPHPLGPACADLNRVIGDHGTTDRFVPPSFVPLSPTHLQDVAEVM